MVIRGGGGVDEGAAAEFLEHGGGKGVPGAGDAAAAASATISSANGPNGKPLDVARKRYASASAAVTVAA